LIKVDFPRPDSPILSYENIFNTLLLYFFNILIPEIIVIYFYFNKFLVIQIFTNNHKSKLETFLYWFSVNLIWKVSKTNKAIWFLLNNWDLWLIKIKSFFFLKLELQFLFLFLLFFTFIIILVYFIIYYNLYYL